MSSLQPILIHVIQGGCCCIHLKEPGSDVCPILTVVHIHYTRGQRGDVKGFARNYIEDERQLASSSAGLDDHVRLGPHYLQRPTLFFYTYLSIYFKHIYIISVLCVYVIKGCRRVVWFNSSLSSGYQYLSLYAESNSSNKSSLTLL